MREWYSASLLVVPSGSMRQPLYSWGGVRGEERAGGPVGF
jgi:hypothetical protein